MKYLYPEGKKKALTFSYDDGQIHDIRLTEILRSHGLKGTFNLNSGTLANEDNSIFVNKNKLDEIYAGHEIAVHGVEHKNLGNCTDTEIITEIVNDRIALEKLTGAPVQGMAYAYGAYNEHIMSLLKACGIKYSRTVGENPEFTIPGDFLEWNSTCHHGHELMKKADEFLALPDWKELPLMYVWGHSFEFARNDNWNVIEEFAEKMQHIDEIWYATNGEIYDYVQAIRRLEFSADGKMVKNPSMTTVWYQGASQKPECIQPGELKVWA